MNTSKIIFFDLEMCCWEDKPYGEIIEIGLAKFDLKTNKITNAAQYYVKPDKDVVSDYCTSVNGITPSIIKKQGRPLNEVIASMIKNFGGKNAIYASWGRDDIVLFNECNSKNISLPFIEFLNISTLYQLHYFDSSSKPSLTLALKKEGLDFIGKAHSGVDDAINLALLYQKIFIKS